MTRISEKAMAAATTLAAAVAVVAALVGHRTGLLVFTALLPLAILALLFSVFTWGRLRLQRLAAEESRDAELARAEQPDSALFTRDEAEPFSIGRTARQFETFVVPALPVLIALAFGLWAWRLYQGLSGADAAAAHEPLFGCAFLAGIAFFLFLLSRYLIGLARDPALHLVRAPGIALGLTSLGALAGALAAVAVEAGWRGADRATASVLTAVLAILAAENFCFFLVTLYAPGRGRRLRPAYESRLGAFVTDPAAWARDLAQSFDYQFGTRTAESTAYRFLRSAVLPLVLFQLATFYAMSSLVFLGPGEEGVLERFGRPRTDRWHLASGFHLKAPWPFETVRRVPAGRIQTIPVGFEGDDAGPRRDTLLWTIPHYRNEDTFVTASHPAAGAATSEDATSVGLISFNLPVEYRITNIHAHVYRHQDPAGLLRDLACRALTREVAARDLVDLLGPRRLEISAPIRERVQREADALGLGVEILFVGLQGVHPPVAVAEAFQSVVGALEEREAAILAARAYTNSVLPVAAANADRVRLEGEAQRLRRASSAQAEAQLFEQRLASYRKAPEVFANGLYLATLRDALAGVRKYIVDHRNAREVLYFNFQEKPFPDLFELGPAPGEGEHP